MNVYPTLLQAHGMLRWVVFLVLAIRAARGLQAWAADVRYSRNDRILSLTTWIVGDTQCLFGLLV